MFHKLEPTRSLVLGLVSGDTTPARNLRGMNVPVKAGENTITFPLAKADADYAVFIEQEWLSNRAVTRKSAERSIVTFADSAPANATVDWTLLR